MGPYNSFSQLRQYENAGKDYRIRLRKAPSGIVVLAPHGGGIEPGTAEIADAIAGGEHSFYAFQGMKKTGNRNLHLTSVRFDEPVGRKIAQASLLAVAIHGCRGQRETIFIGGRSPHLKRQLLRSLQQTGFNAVLSKAQGLQGTNPTNLCNRCRCGKGVQLEISRGLRNRLLAPLDALHLRKRTDRFSAFVGAVRLALRQI